MKIYLCTNRNKWNQVKISETRIFSSLDKLLEFLLEAWNNYDKINITGTVSLSLSLFYKSEFHAVHEIELDSENKPKKMSYSSLEKKLKEIGSELYARLLLMSNI